MLELPASALALGSVLGSGSFGAVHTAEYAGAKYAAKRLRSDAYAGGGDGVELVWSEIEMLWTKRHPHLVPLTGVVLAPRGSALPGVSTPLRSDEALLLMQVPAGGGLNLRAAMAEAAAAERSTDAARAAAARVALLRSLVAVASALVFLHDRLVAHLDIKPDNVLLDSGPPAGGTTVWLADLGLAVAATDASGSVLPAGAVGRGTPAYMAPEMRGGAGAGAGGVQEPPLRLRADVYSFGVMVVEVLMLSRPISELSAELTAAFGAGGSAQQQAALLAPLPSSLRPVIKRSLSAKAEERPTMLAVFEQLAALYEERVGRAFDAPLPTTPAPAPPASAEVGAGGSGVNGGPVAGGRWQPSASGGGQRRAGQPPASAVVGGGGSGVNGGSVAGARWQPSASGGWQRRVGQGGAGR